MLYHKNLGFPKTLNLLDSYNLHVRYSNHALQACNNDRYGKIIPLNQITFNRKQIIEIETANDKRTDKVLIRLPYDATHDLLLAIQLDDNTVKTVWLNEKCDAHRTLNLSKYNTPQQKIHIRF